MSKSSTEGKKDSPPTFSGALLGMGNPLLDISAEVSTDMLDKYELKLNNAILAEEKHMPIYDEMQKDYDVEYIAGGATQNSIRVAQYMMSGLGRQTAYIGAVGDDQEGKTLKQEANKDQVHVDYMINKEVSTGVCAVLINEKERSMVTNLSAANTYKLEHLKTKGAHALLESASVVYIAGFFLTVSVETIEYVAQYCVNNNKMLVMNLSAPFISQFFSEPLLKVLPYVSVIIGNESEAEAFSAIPSIKEELAKMEGGDLLGNVAQVLANLPLCKELTDRGVSRLAVVTCGPDAIHYNLAQGFNGTFDVPKISDKEIVDVNGAGDAFVGGFLAQFIRDRQSDKDDKKEDGPKTKRIKVDGFSEPNVLRMLKAGCFASSIILRTSGTKLPFSLDVTALNAALDKTSTK